MSDDYLDESTHEAFLVMGLSIQHITDSSEPTLPFESVVQAGDRVTFALVEASDHSSHDGLITRAFWTIRFSDPVSIRTAHHHAHAIVSLTPIVPFCVARAIDDLVYVAPLPHRFVADGNKLVSADLLLRGWNSGVVDSFGGESSFHQAYGSCMIEGIGRAKELLPLLNRYSLRDDFARSCSYLHLSMTELGIDVCDWAQSDFDQGFYRFVSVSRAESAFLNAFKAIESLVGEPSKNRTSMRLRERLEARGLRAEELVGYRHEMSILDRILLCLPIRDQIAAHGIAKYKRDLRLSEIIELQALARFLLLYSSAT